MNDEQIDNSPKPVQRRWPARRPAPSSATNSVSTQSGRGPRVTTRVRSTLAGILVASSVVAVNALTAQVASAEPATSAVQKAEVASSARIQSPCDGSIVSTTGRVAMATVTRGQHTRVIFDDRESGNGYTFVMVFRQTYNALSSSYSGTAKGVWTNGNPAKDFHATIAVTTYVDSNNAPKNVSATAVSATCGR